MLNIVLTGGGTAGHIMPNIALLDELKKRFDNVYYIGSNNSMEKKIAEQNGIPFYYTDVVKFSRDKLLSNLKIPHKLHDGINQAKKILQNLKPNIIFAKGGFVSLPTALAAKKLKIPVICHESDATLGLANKIISNFAITTITSYDTTTAKRVLFCGNPIRSKILNGNSQKIKNELQLDSKPVLLILGGSLGALSINNVIVNNIDELSKKFNIIHITGKSINNIQCQSYYKKEFVHNIEDYYSVADIIISRAGASAVSEIMALNKKVIFVPLENKSSRGDQLDNANRVSQYRNVVILRQSDFCIDAIFDSIKLLNDKTGKEFIYDKNTNKRICDELYRVANVIKTY